MKRQVVHIFGASGAGTSTLGRYIAERTGFFFMDTDDYFWAPVDPPFSVRRPPEERLSLMRRDLEAHDKVVLSGSLTGWGDVLIPLFTLAVRVETDDAVRLERIERREKARFGARIEPGGDMYEAHVRFIEWAAAYESAGPEQRSRALHDIWQKRLACPLLTADGARPPEENFEAVRKWLEKEENE